jgi:hypothetical protein
MHANPAACAPPIPHPSPGEFRSARLCRVGFIPELSTLISASRIVLFGPLRRVITPPRVIPAHFDLAWRSRQLCTLPDVTAEPELDESQSDQWHLQSQADMEETVNEPVG